MKPAPGRVAHPAPAPATQPLWTAIKTSPAYAPELLALTAVDRIGDEARAHLSWLRETYPTATPEALARLAAQRFVRDARAQGALAGLLGPVALFAESVGLALTHARLVLHVAAAYGADPTDPRRAAELLVLQGVHADIGDAEAALADTQRPPATTTLGRLARVLSRPAGRSVFKIALARRTSRLVPGAGAAVAALLDGRDAERLAARAVRHYRKAARRP
jgi:hypothetical protein